MRKGNMVAKEYADNTVDSLIYAVEKSLDSYKFNVLSIKDKFIRQFKTNTIAVRKIDDGGMDEESGMNYSVFMAATSGNTDLLEKAKLEKKIMMLESERKAFNNSKGDSRFRLHDYKTKKEHFEDLLRQFDADLAHLQEVVKLDAQGNKLNVLQIDGVTTGDMNVLAAKLKEISSKAMTDGIYQKIGTIYDFPIMVRTRLFFVEDKASYDNTFCVSSLNGDTKYTYNNGHLALDPKVSTMNFLNALERIPKLIDKYIKDLNEVNQDLPILEKVVDGAWNKESELKDLKKQLTELDRRILATICPERNIEEADIVSEERSITNDQEPERKSKGFRVA